MIKYTIIEAYNYIYCYYYYHTVKNILSGFFVYPRISLQERRLTWVYLFGFFYLYLFCRPNKPTALDWRTTTRPGAKCKSWLCGGGLWGGVGFYQWRRRKVYRPQQLAEMRSVRMRRSSRWTHRFPR